MGKAQRLHSALIAPRLSLGTCVRAFVARSTLDCDLRPDERLNHVPASPACAITWFIQGSASWAGDDTPVGRIAVCGPKTRPAVSVNPGPVETLTMLVMPDALHALTGFNAGLYVDRTCAAEDVFDAEWLVMLHAVLEEASFEARVRLIEDFLEARWVGVRRNGWSRVHTYGAWVQALAMRAVMSGTGRGVRQTSRRIRAWAGLPLGSLMGLSRAERAFIDAQLAHAANRVEWARVATDAGYADQPHLCREMRRVTGLSPRQLLHRIDVDECFWIYRLWR